MALVELKFMVDSATLRTSDCGKYVNFTPVREGALGNASAFITPNEKRDGSFRIVVPATKEQYQKKEKQAKLPKSVADMIGI